MNLSVLYGTLIETPSVSALSPCVPGSIRGWGLCKTYQWPIVVHWSKVLGSHRVIEWCILNDVKSGLLKSYLSLGKDLHKKTWTVTTTDWLRLSSKSELCDGSLTTETTHDTVMLHWKKKKKRNSDYKSQTMLSFFVYMQKHGISVFKWQAIPKWSGRHLKHRKLH